jgi:hypothetical protein
MDDLAEETTGILALYAPDEGATLRQTAGAAPAQTATALARRVWDRVGQEKPELVADFRSAPDVQEPLTSALTQILANDADFATEVRTLVQQYRQAVSNVAGAGGVAAQEIHAPVATQGSVAPGGDITITGDGNIIGNENSGQVQKGGIHARTIEAENVVDGVHLQGGVPADVEALVGLAQAIQRGSITADEIRAGNVVSGVLFVAGKPPVNHAELRAEVAALREQVQQAIAAGEVADAGDAEDVTDALAKTEAELEKPEPNGKRVVRHLESATDILTGVAKSAAAARNVGWQIVKLAPVAAALSQLAQAIF